MATAYARVPIKGFEGLYEIDTEGFVYSLTKNRKMKPWITVKGYYMIGLRKNGERTVKTVHRLVAETFIPNPNNYPVINHKDETTLNNAVDNLEWCTQKYNMNYGTVLQRLSMAHKGRIPSEEQNKRQSEFMKIYRKEHSRIRVKCEQDGKIYNTYAEAARAYGIARITVVRSCASGKTVRGAGVSFHSWMQ